MPNYEYRCPRCGTKFEKLVRLASSSAPVSCPSCSYEGIERMVSLCGWSGGTGERANSCAPNGGG